MVSLKKSSSVSLMVFLWITVIAVFLLFVCIGFIKTLYSKLPHGKNTFVFFQVTRGDGFYLQTANGKEVIWDGGDDRSFLGKLSEYRVFWDRYIDYWIVTHPDSDHYYGGLEVLKQLNIGTIILTGVDKDDEKYKQIFSLAEEKGIKIIIATDQTDFMVDGVFIDTLFPFESIYGSSEFNGNNYSLVQRVSHEGTSFLLTGDIEKETEKILLESGILLSSTFLKVPHHGSKSSSSLGFLQSVSPEKAFFTTGTENRFSHPHQEVLDRYETLDIPFQNSQDGDIVIEF